MSQQLKAEDLQRLSLPDEAAVNALLKKEMDFFDGKMVILDDDPTGVQTVHDISVYTGWDRESMHRAFSEETSLFYILTNSRALSEKETVKAHKEIANAVHEAAACFQKPYLFISRSDSCLRGHYPLETEILREVYEKNTHFSIDAEVLCPFFEEGGRLTVHNIHYVREGNAFIPANETEFAKDATFGYTADTLPNYVEEKTGGRYRAEDVTAISLQELRDLEFEKIEKKLLLAENFNKIIVNATSYTDLKVFCIALFRCMKKGKHFMFRTAASLVKVMGGIPDKALLCYKDMIKRESGSGGLIVVGSYTRKTTDQLQKLREIEDIVFVEADVSTLASGAAEEEIKRCLREEAAIANGRTVCVYTSRQLITAHTGHKEDDLALSVGISRAVQRLVGELSAAPAFIIAKGGITSSDIGVKALKVKKATVLGQVKPGIPVWRLGEESKFPGIPYIIFPGNTGSADTLKEVCEVLLSKDSRV